MPAWKTARATRRARAGLHGILLCFAALLASPARGVMPPQDDEPTRVVLAVLPVLRETLPPGRAVLDAETLCTAKLIGWNCPPALRDAARSLGFVLHGKEFTHACLPGGRSCRLLGGNSLVSLSSPVVSGREAELEARVWWVTGRRSEPIATRTVRLRLARAAGGWEVVESSG